MRFVVDGAAQDVTLTVSAAAETFVVPLGGKPTQVILDPGNNILKTLDEKKARRAVDGAAGAAPMRAIDRVRAARALGKAGSPTAVDALDAWRCASELAGSCAARRRWRSARSRPTAARDAIAAAVGNEAHPKARRHLVKALGALPHDERAADAVLQTLAGDASYFVEAESAMSLAKTRSPRAFDALKEAMTRPSYLDVIQSMCLSGMAELRDERGIEIALEAAKYGKPVIGRRAAIALLGALGAEFSAAQAAGARDAESSCSKIRDFRVRIAAVEALRVLGDAEADRRAQARGGQGSSTGACGGGRAKWRACSPKAPRRKSRCRTLRDAVEKLQDENS